MKKVIVLLLTALILCLGTAMAENVGFLGQPFPDFSATDTQGNTFTLSEVLQDHEAVLINIWTTWCGPCEREFPFLKEVYEEYGDRIAFIALSADPSDTIEKIGEYRESHGITFPMGRDEGLEITNYIGLTGYPTTVMVDRFGIAVYTHTGAFAAVKDVKLLVEAFMGDQYTETTVLTAIPRDASTVAFPVSAARALYVDNENARLVTFYEKDDPETLTVYVVNDSVARLRFEIAASDPPAGMVYYDGSNGTYHDLSSLLDPAQNVYVYEQAMPDDQEESHYTAGWLMDYDNPNDPDTIQMYMISGDDYIEEFADLFRAQGYEITWEYEEEEPEENIPVEAYLLHTVDQNGEPVSGVYVNFCTDTACTMFTSDENGLITFDGEPDEYHVQILMVPEGYSFDSAFELYTGRVYGEWILRIRKDR